ncbi:MULTISPECIES: prolipoprotein diacylglyceryl transferase [Pacificibacter]|uniref:prolipoprotein diacylglyceryl transferase n=1 Tax=Pacificibacter TaxID=1042323 RepID=UPI001C09D012|nr:MULTISPECIES: prolipoprotein diacylglyceryl transferase [Pacificibacter]MBU2934790.1 prolipoprotein diacylglyceryl transferase [Pacificibacter marinus]MDO6615764.1 prolipoprotein diacylglyceryl transferase [Pacificibacter sp. 1_MG-2023]
MFNLPAVIQFPDISPVLFSIELGPINFALHWYALAYIFGVLIAWGLAVTALKSARLWPDDTTLMTRDQLDDMLSWLVLGVIAGGRLGYVLFYKPSYFLAHPVEIPMIWQGGMAFHGGFLGVVVAAYLYGRIHKLRLLSLADLLAMAVPAGLLLGRMANFVNAELWGRPSDAPWAVVFPGDAAQACATATSLCARHPSQLYEGLLEGLLLGTVLLVLVWRFNALKKPGLIAGLFFAGYGISRFIVEFFRQADAQFITPDNPMGHVFIGLSMGQLLSVPMILIGLALAMRAARS